MKNGKKPKNANVKTSGVSKALAAKKAALRGSQGKIVKKVYYKPRFYLPKTQKLARNPKYPRKTIQKEAPLNDYSIFDSFLKSQKSMLHLDNQNTFVFTCDIRANKPQISSAFKHLMGVRPLSVRTLVGIDGKKKAYVRIPQTSVAAELASKVGFA